MRMADLERNKQICKLYFEDKLSVTEIGNKINLSISQVSRILSKSPNYNQEKANRKDENYKRHNEQAKEIMKKKRNKKQAEDKATMDKLHNQASLELSYTHTISKIDIRKNCSSAYNYNSSKKRFELDNTIAYSNDMPKIIKY